MSYVPCYPIVRGGTKVSSRRLEEEDQDFLLISKMFFSRGGVVYVKKIVTWVVEEGEKEIYGRHCGAVEGSSMGFLLNEVSEK